MTAETRAAEVLAEIEKAGRHLASVLTDERVRHFGSDPVFLAVHNAQNDLARAVALLRDDREGDLLSRLACVSEATSWDQPYETRIASIRGMCDLTTDGMTSAPMPSDEYDQESERVTAERAWQEGADWAYGRCYAGPVPAKFNPYAAPVAPDGGDQR